MSTNEQTIIRAFNKLSETKHRTIINGMRNMLQNGVQFALEQHLIANVENHLHSGDSYGWAIGYNGVVLQMRVNTGESLQGMSVTRKLRELVSKRKKGYSGYIMAGMKPYALYKFDLEVEFLSETSTMLEVEFHRFFKRV